MKIIQKIKLIPEKISARFLKRTENVLLEHLPEKHQKSVVATFRAGFWLNIAGIFWTIMGLFLIALSIMTFKGGDMVNILIPRIVFVLFMLLAAFLGGWVMRLRIRPSQMFGLSIVIALISLALFAGIAFVFISSNLTHLDEIYGEVQMILIDSMLFMMIFFPAILMCEFSYYLFVAHKGYLTWYEERSKKEAKQTSKTRKTKKKSSASSDDDLL